MNLRALVLLAALCASSACAPADASSQKAAPEASTLARAHGSAVVGQPAPDFGMPALDGKTVRLSDFSGKTVVLEWFNPDCPFVKYAHGEGGPLRSMAATYAEQGVVWLAVNSGAPGKQGAGRERNVAAVTEYGMAHPVLLDEDGQVGRAYGAKTTPHVYVVDAAGTLVYAGALDGAPLGRAEGPATPYLSAALADLAAGRPVTTASTKPYGCSVKYGE